MEKKKAMTGLGFSTNIRRIITGLRRWQTAVWAVFFLLAPALALAAGIDKTLNIVSLIIIFLLFVGCVLLVPASELAAFHRFTVWVFLFGFLLNTWYELLHSVFYTHFTEPGYTYPELVAMLLKSAVADGFISLGLLLAVTVFRRGNWQWTMPWDRKDVSFVVTLGLGVQILAEIIALNSGEWAYNAAMPVIPVLDVGLTPTLQMPLLILPTFWLAQRVMRSRVEVEAHSPKES